MNKIPVGKTIAFAYSFAIGDFLNVLGVIWAPTLLVGIASYMFLPDYFHGLANMQVAGGPDIGVVQSVARQYFLFFVVALVLRAVTYVGVTELALGLKHGPVLFYFSLGASVWRLVGAFALVFIVMIVAAVVVAIVGGIVGGVVGGVLGTVLASGNAAAAKGLVGLFVVLAFLAIYCAMIYIAVRLSFFVTPVVVAEKRISLSRSWQLGGGNFWRIIGVSLAVILPASIVIGILWAALLAFSGLAFPHIDASMSEVARQHAMMSWLEQVMLYAREKWILLLPVGLVAGTLMYGLVGGAMAFAYRALVPAEGAAEA